MFLQKILLIFQTYKLMKLHILIIVLLRLYLEIHLLKGLTDVRTVMLITSLQLPTSGLGDIFHDPLKDIINTNQYDLNTQVIVRKMNLLMDGAVTIRLVVGQPQLNHICLCVSVLTIVPLYSPHVYTEKV